MNAISFTPAAIVSKVAAVTATNVELAVLTVTKPEFLQKTQFSIYADVTLGGQKLYFRYYFSFDGGTSWYQTPVKDLVTTKGELTNLPSLIDSSAPAKVVEDIAVSGANAFKITAQTDANTVTINNLVVVARDN